MHPDRLARLHRLLDEEDLDALVLRHPANVAWASLGARTHIDVSGESGVGWLVVTRDETRVVTSRIEAGRLGGEEFADDSLQWTVLDWDVDPATAVPTGETVGTDGFLAGLRDVSGPIEAARRALLPEEQQRYRALGRDAATALTAACMSCGPEDDEFRWASRVAEEVVRRGADPLVLLVAGEERVRRYRHPLPTAARAGNLVMVVICARRHGLFANATRFVAFGALPADLREIQLRLLEVEAAFLDATRPGSPVKDVLAAGIAAYGRHGFDADADEWRRHHQGGPTGYLSRDHVATTAASEPVELGQAFAWNPSVPGLKVEDTVLCGSEGLEVLTVDPEWPTVEVADRRRPVVFERS